MTGIAFKLKAIGKVIVAALGLLATALVNYSTLVPVEFRGWATAIVALATLVGAYHAPYAALGSNRGAASKLGRVKRSPRKRPNP